MSGEWDILTTFAVYLPVYRIILDHTTDISVFILEFLLHPFSTDGSWIPQRHKQSPFPPTRREIRPQFPMPHVRDPLHHRLPPLLHLQLMRESLRPPLPMDQQLRRPP